LKKSNEAPPETNQLIDRQGRRAASDHHRAGTGVGIFVFMPRITRLWSSCFLFYMRFNERLGGNQAVSRSESQTRHFAGIYSL